MALLLPPLRFFSPPSSSPSLLNNAAGLYPGLKQSGILLQSKSFKSMQNYTPLPFVEKRSMVVRSSVDTEGNDGNGLDVASPPEAEVSVSIEDLPLESKERLKLEQKLRMKLAKKIRLRRKRLVRKRRMRKKGRWPPSKMKKNKNV